MDKRLILQKRAEMLLKARAFFATRGVIEVDCPYLSRFASIDCHIDLIETEEGFLHSSPEYPMKRLLSLGLENIYQLAHVFRKGEIGRRHQPEFTLVEWYRSFSFEELIEETADFVRLFLGALPLKRGTYRETVFSFCGIDPIEEDASAIQKVLMDHGIDYGSFSDKDDLLHLLLSSLVEPHLGKGEIFALFDYPKTQAALAKKEGEIAKRFELYFEGVELANGYDELLDSKEQHERLLEQNRLREALGKRAYPIDVHFLEALKQPIKPQVGVAVGFDRLMMLMLGEQSIGRVLPFSFEEM